MPTDAARRRQIGLRIRAARVKAGIPEDELVDRIYTQTGNELPIARVSDWENGLREPTVRQKQMIADALGIAMSDLLPEGANHDRT